VGGKGNRLELVLKRGKRSLCAACLLALLVLNAAAPAQADDEWLELAVGQFTLLYQPAFQSAVTSAASRFGQVINDDYTQLSTLYGETLALPITLRVYSDTTQFIALTALAPRLGEGVFHAHSGGREIALVAPFPADLFTTDSFRNAIRHELNGLFLYELSDGGLPPGLELGFNQYVEMPGPQTAATRDKVEAAFANGQLLAWEELFDSAWVYLDHEIAYPQSQSIATFLIDSYGFGKLVELARAVPDANGYRAAIARVYGRPMDRLEQDWLAYLPDYFSGRWQINALFNYDLEPFVTALDAGAYTQALRGLDVVIPFLQATGQTTAVQQAEVLRSAAMQGTTAGEMVKAMRDALQTGVYTRTLELGELARATYLPLLDSSRLDEIAAYEARAQEILALRSRLDRASAQVSVGQLGAAEPQLLAVGARLQALGDSEGALIAEALLDDIRARRVSQARWAAFVAVAVVALIGGHRVYDTLQGRRRKAVRVL